MAAKTIGIVCYPSSGGSGIVATELGLALAHRGWNVHFITYALPVRLKGYEENVFFHEVQTENYPVFHHPPYDLSLAVKITEVAETHGMDIVHAHYAIPHATCAYLAQQMLWPRRLATVTTLHGTDITLVGVQPSFRKIVRFSIDQSGRVTAVSGWLRDQTVASLAVESPIEVIPNFVDAERFRPRRAGELRCHLARRDEKVILHASNFRPVKNLPAVIQTFARIRAKMPARLVLVGDGPERSRTQQEAQELGLADSVSFLGLQDGMEEILAAADLVLLPSEHESFGLVALEAMACGVPVIATANGGPREVIEHGRSGFLVDPHDVDAMSTSALSVLGDPDRHADVARAARERAETAFAQEVVVSRYEELYEELLAGVRA